jgi:hypothetical protein
VSPDLSDPKLAHLDGLNLSRSWMLEGIATGLPKNDNRLPSEASITRAVIGWEALPSTWSRSEGFQARCRLRLTAPRLLLDDCDPWTLNASLTRLSNYRKYSKRRILGHLPQATSLLPIEDTTKGSHIARGLSFGGGTASAADLSLPNSDCLRSREVGAVGRLAPPERCIGSPDSFPHLLKSHPSFPRQPKKMFLRSISLP